MQISTFIEKLIEYWGDRDKIKLCYLIDRFQEDRHSFERVLIDNHNEILESHIPAFENELELLKKERDFFAKQSEEVHSRLGDVNIRFIQLIDKHNREIEKINSFEKLYYEAKIHLDHYEKYPKWVHWLFRKNAAFNAS